GAGGGRGGGGGAVRDGLRVWGGRAGGREQGVGGGRVGGSVFPAGGRRRAAGRRKAGRRKGIRCCAGDGVLRSGPVDRLATRRFEETRYAPRERRRDIAWNAAHDFACASWARSTSAAPASAASTLDASATPPCADRKST